MGGGASCDAGAPRDEVIVDGDAGILERAGASLERPAPARELRRLIDGGGLCAVVAPSGSGKSTFVASAVAALRAEGAFDVVRCVFVGAAGRRRCARAGALCAALRRDLDARGLAPPAATIPDDALGLGGWFAAALEALAGDGAKAALLALGGSMAALRKLEGKADRSSPLYLRLVGYAAGDWPGTVAGAYDALLAALPDDAAAKLLLCSIWVSGGALFPAELVDVVGEKPAKALASSRLPAHAVGAGDAAAAKRYLCAVAYGERKCAAGLAGDLARDYEAAARAFPKERAFRDFAETARANAHVLGPDRWVAGLWAQQARNARRTSEVHVLDGDGNERAARGPRRRRRSSRSPSREHHLLSVARRGDGGSDAFLFDVDTAEKLAAYDVPRASCATRWAPDGESVLAVATAADVVATGDNDCRVRVWTGLDSATHVASEDLGGWVTSLALSPNGSDVLAATFGRDAALHLLSRREGRLEMMARGALGSPIAWCAVLAGDLFVTASESKLLHAWRPRPNRALNRAGPRSSSRSSRSSRRRAFGSPDGVGGQGAVHADTATLAVGDEAGRLYVLDLDVDGHFKTV
ncbi:hypothetical protein JL720_7804 [Aureococcus anophagefferens]|nr:hypothetical protein JL720_7804 [Aureococcus anophagefferens]